MIKKAELNEIDTLTGLALQLWPGMTEQEMREDLQNIALEENAVFFLAYDGAHAVGFAQCQLRRDYVEGTETAPVGYLEGIYVAQEYRKRGIARELLQACEAWAKTKGCGEFASDCELDNEQSLRFHLKVGFVEANRIICFAKKL